MNYSDQITNLMNLASKQKDCYQATSFWDTAIAPMIQDLNEYGIENFRSWPSALSYFVPTYGMPGNGLTTNLMDALGELSRQAETRKQQQVLQKFISGENQAFADYRVATAVLKKTAPWLLENATESKVGNPKEHFVFDKNTYSRSFLNYLLGLAALSEHCDLKTINNVLEIGGGYGTLGEILHNAFDNGTVKYCNLDIPPTCAVAEYYLGEASSSEVLGALDNRIVDFGSNDWSLAVKPNWEIENIRGQIDLFVNFISFQEMEPNVVQNYLNHVLALNPKFIVLRHIKEGKQRKSTQNQSGVLNPTTPDFYDSLLNDFERLHRDATPFGFITPDNFHSEVLIYRAIKS